VPCRHTSEELGNCPNRHKREVTRVEFDFMVKKFGARDAPEPLHYPKQKARPHLAGRTFFMV
jgi:hypothetical protein